VGKIILVTGGARSGKSSFAEQYAMTYGKKISYIATAQIYDAEMKYRVKLHRERRPANWVTYEAPYDAEKAIEKAAQQSDLILFDCLTLYLSNLLCAKECPQKMEDQFVYVKEHIEKLICYSEKSAAQVIFVTNEVGMGIVPENALARAYRDLAGLSNQMMAKAADCVYLVVSGIPVDIKKLAVKLEERI